MGLPSEAEGDMMWDIYEDDDSFEKMVKAKVTLISCYHRRMKCRRFFHFLSLLTKANDGVEVTYVTIDVFCFCFFSSVEFMNQFNVENPSCHNKAGAIQGKNVFFLSQPEGPPSPVLEHPEAR